MPQNEIAMKKRYAYLCLVLLVSIAQMPFELQAQQPVKGPKILVVTAHPDDETTFSVTLYKITHDLNGTVDIALMTDASGGFNGSELGSVYYGIQLTDSVTGRARLPLIRKQELMNAGKIMGIRNFYFFDQVDDFYNTDPVPYVTGKRWDTAYINKRLDKILSEQQYDFVFTMLPEEGQHGHHKTAALMGLRAVLRYKGARPPIILAGNTIDKNQAPAAFDALKGFPETTIKKGAPFFYFNRSVKFGHRNLLSYKIIADWVINEYKTQGDLQENAMHKGDLDMFSYYDINPASGIAAVQALFDQLKNTGFSATAK